MDTSRGSIRLQDLIGIVIVVSLVGAIVIPALDAVRRRNDTAACAGNLFYLGRYVMSYCGRST